MGHSQQFSFCHLAKNSFVYKQLTKLSFSLDNLETVSQVAFSLLGVILTTIIAAIILMIPMFLGFRRYPGLMPTGGTCSASIAAACWRPRNDEHAAIDKVQWGELMHSTEHFEDDNDVGEHESNKRVPHLCFTSFEVGQARKHVVYH